MKINILLALSLFAGSISAHPQGLMDRLYKRVLPEKITRNIAFKVFKPNEDDVLKFVPDNEIVKIKLSHHKHYNITTQEAVKRSAQVVSFLLNAKEAFEKRNAQTSQKNQKTNTAVIGRVVLDTVQDTVQDTVKDLAIDGAQDFLVDHLPESSKEVHPAIKWMASKATGFALSLAYDKTKNYIDMAIKTHFNIK